MDRSGHIETALSDCLEAMERGEPLGFALQEHPQYQAELAPLLRIAAAIRRASIPHTLSSEVIVQRMGESIENRSFASPFAHGMLTPFSRRVHDFARSHPTATWQLLFLMFSGMALVAWMTALGSALLVGTRSEELQRILLFSGLTVLPLFLAGAVFRATTRWRGVLIFSPVLQHVTPAGYCPSGGLARLSSGVVEGWNSGDGAVRLFYRVMGWTLLRLLAFVLVFELSLPLLRAS